MPGLPLIRKVPSIRAQGLSVTSAERDVDDGAWLVVSARDNLIAPLPSLRGESPLPMDLATLETHPRARLERADGLICLGVEHGAPDAERGVDSQVGLAPGGGGTAI